MLTCAVAILIGLHATPSSVQQDTSLQDNHKRVKIESTNTQPLADRVLLMRGYEGLQPETKAADQQRWRAAIEAVDSKQWPLYEHKEPRDTSEFPASVPDFASRPEPIPLYILADIPSAPEGFETRSLSIRATLISRHEFSEASNLAFAKPWPTWADMRLRLTDEGLSYPPLTNNNWTLLASSALGETNFLSPALRQLGVTSLGTLDVFELSPTLWTVVEVKPSIYAPTQSPKGVLIYPLWEATGLQRQAETDARSQVRNSPLSASAHAEGWDWKLAQRQLFVLPQPRVPSRSSPVREWLVIPETIRQLPVPIVSVYVDPATPAFAEDFIIHSGAPQSAVGLRAVCVMSSCTDEQLQSLVKQIGSLMTPESDK